MHLDACLLGKHPEVVPAGGSLGTTGADKAVEILRLRSFLILRVVLLSNNSHTHNHGTNINHDSTRNNSQR